MSIVTILADLHIKSTSEYMFYNRLIQHISTYTKVILLGDVFDFVKTPHLTINYNTDDFNNNKNIVYVYGNHDVIAPRLGFDCVEEYTFGGLQFIHGHQLEVLSSSTGFTLEEYEEFFKRLSYLRCTVGSLPKLLYKMWSLYGNLMCQRNNETVREIFDIMLKRGNIVVGHTHHFMFSSVRRCLMCGSARNAGYIYDVKDNIVYPFDIEVNKLDKSIQSFESSIRKL